MGNNIVEVAEPGSRKSTVLSALPSASTTSASAILSSAVTSVSVSSSASTSSPAAVAASPENPEKSKGRRGRGSHQRSESLGVGFVQAAGPALPAPRSPAAFELSPAASGLRGSHRVVSTSTSNKVSSTGSTLARGPANTGPSPVLEGEKSLEVSPVLSVRAGGRVRSLSKADLDQVRIDANFFLSEIEMHVKPPQSILGHGNVVTTAVKSEETIISSLIPSSGGSASIASASASSLSSSSSGIRRSPSSGSASLMAQEAAATAAAAEHQHQQRSSRRSSTMHVPG